MRSPNYTIHFFLIGLISTLVFFTLFSIINVKNNEILEPRTCEDTFTFYFIEGDSASPVAERQRVERRDCRDEITTEFVFNVDDL